MTRSEIAIPLALLVAAAPATAQKRLPADLDVAGVRLGADPAEAKAGLIKAGYRIDDTSTARSFDQVAESEAASRTGRKLPWPKEAGVGMMHATGPHQEYAQVSFAQTAAGSKVASVAVRIPEEAMTTPAFQAQVTAKYGRPDAVQDQGITMSWCSPEVLRTCGLIYNPDGKQANAYPLLIATSGNGGGALTLEAGTEAEHQLARDREAAVERLAPKTDKAAF